jgi:hypothetical protein
MDMMVAGFLAGQLCDVAKLATIQKEAFAKLDET